MLPPREVPDRYRRLLDQAPALICTFAADGTLTYVNRAYCDLFQRAEGELLGTSFYTLLPDEDTRRAVGDCLRGLCVEEPEASLEHPVIGPDGGVRWHRWTNRAIYGEGGELLYYQAVGDDITQRREAEEALRRKSRALGERIKEQRLLIQASDILANADLPADTVLRWIAALVPGGWQYPEIAGARIVLAGVETAATPNFRDTPWMQSTPIYVRGDAAGSIEVCYLEERPSEGPEGPFLDEERVLLDVLAKRLGGFAEMRDLEAQLRYAERMESVGRLAGGIAHDFNNLLMVMRGNLAALTDDGGGATRAGDALRELEEATRRASELTRKLLLFSQRQPLEPQRARANELAESLVAVAGRLFPETIDIVSSYDARDPAVWADSGLLEQVLMNLAINARDAMPSGGALTISTELVEIDHRAAEAYPDARPGRFVCFAVEDTWRGMPRQVLERIFEPFFTTQEEGRGTGLGLSTAHGIVKQHQGWIRATSREGRGSSFFVYLPIAGEADEDAPPVAPPIAAATGAKPDGATILVAEDDPGVRKMLRRLLRRRGYRILAADSGAEALKLWESSAEEIDLLLTDMVMPGGVSGRELTEILRARKPTLKIIVLTGYSADAASGPWLLEHGARLLEKPCEPRAIEEAIREALK